MAAARQQDFNWADCTIREWPVEMTVRSPYARVFRWRNWTPRGERLIELRLWGVPVYRHPVWYRRIKDPSWAKKYRRQWSKT